MLDIKFIRQNKELIREAIENKRADVDLDKLLSLDEKRRELIESSEGLKAEQNRKSKGPQSPTDLEYLKSLKERIHSSGEELKKLEDEFHLLLNMIPNVPTQDTPIGRNEDNNVVLREVGKIPEFNFTPKEHWELGEKLDIIDNERGSKVSGARFSYLKGGAAMLEFSLIQYALSILTDETTLKKIIKKNNLDISSKPFIPVVPPVMIKPEPFQKMDRLEPKDERYYIPSDDLYLVGSAEHTLGAMHMDESFKEADLPIRYIGFSTAFRREAGSYGKDTRGIIRVHQFDKLEMESFTTDESSLKEQDFIVALQEYIIQGLEMPYRVMAICTGDMGKPDARQIDLEVWMPGQNKYRETNTSDYMTDYQSRRLNIKVKKADGSSSFVHMNDATAIAIGRMIVGIIENYQTKDGTVKVPKVLQKYMGGLEEIKGSEK